ncbi:hypothetical protein DFJ67_2314 [Asanoa ferruginea]|uniref:Uncharacterized protein n=1 Tax=Asanoa ferruginea TaxID=53367 RepID=A0A3D9ZGE8_9ACTN|nr:hypothetical protein DFJ67_2314 [Asanoa ferruginea]
MRQCDGPGRGCVSIGRFGVLVPPYPWRSHYSRWARWSVLSRRSAAMVWNDAGPRQPRAIAASVQPRHHRCATRSGRWRRHEWPALCRRGVWLQLNWSDVAVLFSIAYRIPGSVTEAEDASGVEFDVKPVTIAIPGRVTAEPPTRCGSAGGGRPARRSDRAAARAIQATAPARLGIQRRAHDSSSTGAQSTRQRASVARTPRKAGRRGGLASLPSGPRSLRPPRRPASEGSGARLVGPLRTVRRQSPRDRPDRTWHRGDAQSAPRTQPPARSDSGTVGRQTWSSTAPSQSRRPASATANTGTRYLQASRLRVITHPHTTGRPQRAARLAPGWPRVATRADTDVSRETFSLMVRAHQKICWERLPSRGVAAASAPEPDPASCGGPEHVALGRERESNDPVLPRAERGAAFPPRLQRCPAG